MTTPKEAQVTGWICAALSFTIIACRVVLVRHKERKFDLSSWISVASLSVIVARATVNQYVLLYGTSNDAIKSNMSTLDRTERQNLKTGSILALVARLLITTFFWLQSSILLLFYSRILDFVHWVSVVTRFCWAFMVVSYIAVVLATFLECQPFSLYWQLIPHPGHCIRAYAQLFCQGISNIILDSILLTMSLPLLSVPQQSKTQRLRIYFLVALGTFCAIVTCVRLALIHRDQSYQVARSFWASVQMLASAFVANAPTIYGSLKAIARQRSVQSTRRASRPEAWTNRMLVPPLGRLEESTVEKPDTVHSEHAARHSDHIV